MRNLNHGYLFLIFFPIYILATALSVVGIPILVIHLVCMIKDADIRLQNAQESLKASLMDGEELLEMGAELRLFAVFNRRSLVAITNSRIVYISRPVFGGFKMVDVQWKDIKDAQVSENEFPDLFGTGLKFLHYLPTPTIVININREIALKIYKYAQRQEQEWEEKRRIRKIEEKRAAAGGVHISNAPTATISISSQ